MATTSQEFPGPETMVFYQTFENLESVIFFSLPKPVKWPFQAIFKFSNSDATTYGASYWQNQENRTPYAVHAQERHYT